MLNISLKPLKASHVLRLVKSNIFHLLTPSFNVCVTPLLWLHVTCGSGCL
jgi:hypothetical protein